MGGNVFKWIKRAFWTLLVVFVLGFLHYTLPQHDIVRVTGTYNRLTTVGTENAWAYSVPDSGTAEGTATRDIRFIETAYPDGSVMVYRNEDTGWIWPPYFKWDSSNLQAEATNASRSPDQWVVVTHYGWRLPIISTFPNAVKIRPVDGPDASVFPWVNVVILTFLAFAAFMIRKMWLQFRERMIDPVFGKAGQALDAVGDTAVTAKKEARGFFGRIGAWFRSWRKPG